MAMGAGIRQGAERYRFDGIVVDAVARTLVRNGGIQQVDARAFAVLLELLRRPGELVDRDRLLVAAWGHRRVAPGALTRAIAQLRAALNDNALHPRYIQSRHALGYRFIGRLETGAGNAAREAAVPADKEPFVADDDSVPRQPSAWRWWWLAALLALAVVVWALSPRRAAAAAHPATPSPMAAPSAGDGKRDA